MRPWWLRADGDFGGHASWKSFELQGVWRRLAEGASEKKVRILILRQLCLITIWLGILGVLQFIDTCRGVFS